MWAGNRAIKKRKWLAAWGVSVPHRRTQKVERGECDSHWCQCEWEAKRVPLTEWEIWVTGIFFSALSLLLLLILLLRALPSHFGPHQLLTLQLSETQEIRVKVKVLLDWFFTSHLSEVSVSAKRKLQLKPAKCERERERKKGPPLFGRGSRVSKWTDTHTERHTQNIAR